jgi:divalent metal cation (Fe/Co/Zn/Cd) transporter
METMTIIHPTCQPRLYRLAFGLALFTIFYNIAEGLVATYLGYEDASLALFGFGIDSFIEVISGLGIAHMVLRIRRQPESNRDDFERTALTITGFSFYALGVGLTVTSGYNVWTGHTPSTTMWGIVISLLSIAVMWALLYGKRTIGRQLNSAAILADAECTKVCIWMSMILLASSGIYEMTQFAHIDSLGALGLAYISYNEGKECFEKAKMNSHCSC